MLFPMLPKAPSTAANCESVWVIWPALQPTNASAAAPHAAMRAAAVRGTRMIEAYPSATRSDTAKQRDAQPIRVGTNTPDYIHPTRKLPATINRRPSALSRPHPQVIIVSEPSAEAARRVPHGSILTGT